jgi:hypothetical protein
MQPSPAPKRGLAVGPIWLFDLRDRCYQLVHLGFQLPDFCFALVLRLTFPNSVEHVIDYEVHGVISQHILV